MRKGNETRSSADRQKFFRRRTRLPKGDILLGWLRRGLRLRVIDLQNNSGDGGQKEIGPELFRDIAMLRSPELFATHAIDAAEQFFTRDRLRTPVRSPGGHREMGDTLERSLRASLGVVLLFSHLNRGPKEDGGRNAKAFA
jgi:hypothetical protein